MATSLERPGVKVRRQVTTVTPQALIPVLRPMVVGPAYEILDLYDGDSLNLDAVLSSPARLVGTRDLHAIPDDGTVKGKSLVLSIKNGPPVTCALPTNLQTTTYLLAVLNRSFTGVVFSMVDNNTYLAVQSTETGDSVSIEVKAGTTAQLGFAIGAKSTGAGTYKNTKMGISFSALPAPRGNSAQLSFDTLTDNIQAFYRQAGLIREFSRTSAVCRYRKRHEFGREEGGDWVNYGFSFLDIPGALDIDKQVGIDNRTLTSRGLSAIDDGDGDQKTTKVGSLGAAASLSSTFHKPAYLAVAVDTGVVPGDQANIGALMLVTRPATAPTGLSGELGNLIAYKMVSGVAPSIVAAETTGGWLITQTLATESISAVLPVEQVGTGSMTAAITGGSKVLQTGRIYVEITTPGAVGVSKFKWSIDDGALSAEVLTGVGVALTGTGCEITFVGAAPGDFLVGDSFEFYAVSETVGGAADALTRSSVTVPGTGTAIGSTADLKISEILTAYAVGAVDTVVADYQTMTPDVVTPDSGVLLSNGASSSLVFRGDPVGGFYGSTGNFLKLAIAESGGAVAFTNDGATGADPDHLRTWTLAAKPVTNAKTVIADGVKTCTIEVNNGSGKCGDAIGFPWGGANGDAAVTLVVSEAVAGEVVTVTFTHNETTGKLAVNIAWEYANGGTHLFSELETALETASTFTKDLLTVTNSDGTGVVPAGSYVIGTDGDQIAAGADPASCGTVQTVVNAQADHNVLASQGSTWNANCPVNAVSSSRLTGGWDPINFKEGELDKTNNYFHGVVVGERDLNPLVTPADTLRTLINGKNLILRVNGGEEQNIAFSTIAAGGDTIQVICDTINARFPGVVAKKRTWTVAGPITYTYLELNSSDCTAVAGEFGRRGLDSSVQVVGGSAIGVLFHDGTDTTRDALYTGLFCGAPLSLKEGDLLYNNGGLVGTVIGFENYSPGGSVVYENAVLLMDSKVLYSATYSNWVAVAANIDFEADSPQTYRVLPLPDAYVDTVNELVILKDNVVRDSTGVPVLAPKYTMYATYKALRKDLKSGVLIRSESDLDQVTPLIPDNPLGFALQLAFQAGDGIVVGGVGVAEISEREPDGTIDAYQEAARWMSTQDVYASGLLTFDKAVHDYFASYVAVQSDEQHKREQVVMVCPRIPTRASSSVVGSGEANKAVALADVVTFSSEVLNVGAVLADIGIEEADWGSEEAFYGLDGSGVMREVYINLTSNSKNYLVRSVTLNGDVYEVQVHCGEAGDNFWDSHEGNEDYFYATDALPTMEVDGEPASILRRGQLVANTEEAATALRDLCAGYNSILVHVVGPEQIEVPVDGLATIVNGYYNAAIAAAQLCGTQPSVPLTGQVIPGVTRTIHPDGMTDYEVGIAAAAGYSMAITENSIVTWRDFLTTKASPIEDFETSMITPDHMCAKVFRAELRSYVGPLAIDSSYLGRVSMVCDAVCKKLVSAGIYKSAKVQSISQDANDPRQIILEISRSIFYPARTILVILV